MASPPFHLLQLDVQLEERDLRQFYAASMALPPAAWIVLSAIGLVGVGLYLSKGVEYLVGRVVLFLGLCGAAIVSAVMAAQPWLLARRERSLIEKLATATFAFTPDDVEIHTPRGSFRHGWTDFERSRETKQAFYLYLTKMNAYILPKRRMDRGTEGALRRILAERVVPSKA